MGTEQDIYYEVLALAVQHYSSLGKESRKARAYLHKRGVTDEVIDDLTIGYGDPERPVHLGLNSEQVAAAAGLGLLYRESMTDAMGGRVVFPFVDERGSIVGLTGRTLTDEEPRYKNTRPIGDKGKGGILYGLFNAKEEIYRKGCVILVEGPFDVAGSWSYGLRNVVGALGLALSTRQKILLGRCSSKLVILLDEPESENAHKDVEKAAADIEAAAVNFGMTVLRRRLPSGMDPASYFKERRERDGDA